MAGLVIGCVTPHPPLLIPEVGRGQEVKVSSTSKAMEKLADMMEPLHIELALAISPHAHYHPQAMGISKALTSEGDAALGMGRGPLRIFKNDLQMVELIEKEAGSEGIAVKSIADTVHKLDWGVMVPMYFLYRALQDILLVPLAFSWLSLKQHYDFGRAIGRAIAERGLRTAVIASGDMSHRLLAEGPYGYDPAGPEFDRRMAEALASMDTAGVLNMPPDIIEGAGECGLRSIVILLGILDGHTVKPSVLSYEGPFGVGYLVASFEVS